MYQEYFFVVLFFALAITSSVHALINKKDSRSALGWVSICIVLPLIGPALYFLFGVNRVKARALKLSSSGDVTNIEALSDVEREKINEKIIDSLKSINSVSEKITQLPLVGGNTCKSLNSGDDAYSEMLQEIDNAKHYIYMCVYIFKRDKVGEKFIEALGRAKSRGVEVCVLIDGVGELYSRKKVRNLLLKVGVKVHRFLPFRLLPFNMSINLRNHRKLLIIDNKISFVGGMNISAEYLQEVMGQDKAINDIHFKVIGDLTFQLKRIFEADWRFSGGEIDSLHNEASQSKLEPNLCRAIADGPGNNLDHLSLVLLSAINAASKEIILITPYFLPSRELIAAFQTASLRGVKVSIILPEKNNLVYVHWASRHMQWELLENGVNIYYQPPPFSHAKLFVVDNKYSLVGSANIDPRSLRLNYEIGVEVYDYKFATNLVNYAQRILKVSRVTTLEEVDSRTIIIKIRDGIAWLFSPYL